MRRPITISTKVDERTKQQLDDLARRERMDTGEPVRLADVVREAIREYVEKRQL